MELQVIRLSYGETYTMSTVVVNGKNFGYCLEDTVRPNGVKVKGETAIPAGRYEVIVSMSNRFKRLMPELLDVENFSGIRIHGGNRSTDTEGCLLIGANRTGQDTIFASLESRITAMIQQDAKKGIKSFVHIFACRS